MKKRENKKTRASSRDVFFSVHESTSSSLSSPSSRKNVQPSSHKSALKSGKGERRKNAGKLSEKAEIQKTRKQKRPAGGGRDSKNFSPKFPINTHTTHTHTTETMATQQQPQMQMQKTSQNITLRGSTEIVTEFFGYAVNSILYQRGLYPPSTFEVKKKYGLGMLVSSDEEIKTYLVSVLDQINEWLIEKKLEKLVLVISSVRTRETVERWVFDIETDSEIGLEEDEENVKPPNNGAEEKNKKYEKSKQDITNEIAAIMRQIAASVTFLPLLEDECSFDLIVYTNKDSETPQEWEESDPRFIRNAETVKLRSFSTKVHSVEAAVAYKAESPLNV